jgi:predicted O-linked N-acetylglucosamine transferase (SPINDLY family)
MTDVPAARLAEMLEQARACHQQGQLASAQALYLKILESRPQDFDVLNNLGVLSGQTNDLAQAVRYFDEAILAAPDNPSGYCNRGLALNGLQHWDAALKSFDRAIALKHDDAIPHYCRGNIHKQLGRFDHALSDYDRAVTIHPGFAQAWFQRGTVLQQLERADAALSSYNRAIEIKGDYAEAYVNRGFVLSLLNRLDAAVASYDMAIAVRPDAVAYVYRGTALKDLGRRDEALHSFDRAIDINADYAEAHLNRGVVLYELNRIDDALASYDRAIAIKPDYAEAHFNRASVLRAVQRFEDAAHGFDTAAALQPDIKFLAGARLEAKLQICDWSHIDVELAQAMAGIERDEAVSHPFALLTFCADPRLQKRAAEIFVRETCPENTSLGAIPKRAAAAQLRIGYFSADFREHPVPRLLAEVIETHDRQRFRVIAFSFGPDTRDPMRKRMEQAFDEFIDVRDQSDREIALMSRDLNIDIAIDLGGYTGNSRTRIFTMRAAPIQVNYLGYPGTMGSGYMDYLVADDTLIPPEDRQHYSEKIVYLPTFQANDSKRRIADRVFTRDELHLPRTGFVFCCFNTNYKVMPDTFDSWMRILARVPGSVLFMDAKVEATAVNLRRHAQAKGIDPARLVFGTPLSLPDWLARHRVADLFLDTLPYNAGTTASDALWAGLPVLTCIGSTFTGRMAASLLKSIGLPELIASTFAQYEDLAVDLAQSPQRLANIKKKLAHNRLTMPLFDQKRFTKNLETAYASIYERYQADLPPDHIRVS